MMAPATTCRQTRPAPPAGWSLSFGHVPDPHTPHVQMYVADLHPKVVWCEGNAVPDTPPRAGTADTAEHATATKLLAALDCASSNLGSHAASPEPRLGRWPRVEMVSWWCAGGNTRRRLSYHGTACSARRRGMVQYMESNPSPHLTYHTMPPHPEYQPPRFHISPKQFRTAAVVGVALGQVIFHS